MKKCRCYVVLFSMLIFFSACESSGQQTPPSSRNDANPHEELALNLLKEELKDKTLWYIAWNDFPAVFNRSPEQTFFGAMAKAGVLELGSEVGEGAAKKYTYNLSEFGKTISIVPAPIQNVQRRLGAARNAFFLGKIRPTAIDSLQLLTALENPLDIVGYTVTFRFEVFDKPEWVPKYEAAYQEMYDKAVSENTGIHAGWFTIQGPNGEYLPENINESIFFDKFYNNGPIKARIEKTNRPNEWRFEFSRADLVR